MSEEIYSRERESLDFFVGADGSAPSAFTLNRPDFKFSVLQGDLDAPDALLSSLALADCQHSTTRSVWP